MRARSRFNVYATDVRRYKKRNLQQAGALLAAFARDVPGPFRRRQSRSRHVPSIPSSRKSSGTTTTRARFASSANGSPVPARTRAAAATASPTCARIGARSRSRSREVNALANRHWRSWQEVDPPRAFPREGAQPFWKDPWVREWEVFRRHLVQLHYDELAQWLVEAGISSERIWSSQGLMAPRGDSMPFADRACEPAAQLRLRRHVDRGRQAGARSPRRHPLWRSRRQRRARWTTASRCSRRWRRSIRKWAIVEYNTSDLRDPSGAARPMPPRIAACATCGISARATCRRWRGTAAMACSSGNRAIRRYRVAQHAARSGRARTSCSPAPDCRWARCCGRSARPSHADGDGWTADAGQRSRWAAAFSRSRPDANGRIALVSPRGLACAACSVPRNSCSASTAAPGCAACACRDAARPTADGRRWRMRRAPALRMTAAGIAVKRTAGDRAHADRSVAHRDHVRANTAKALTRIAMP